MTLGLLAWLSLCGLFFIISTMFNFMLDIFDMTKKRKHKKKHKKRKIKYVQPNVEKIRCRKCKSPVEWIFKREGGVITDQLVCTDCKKVYEIRRTGKNTNKKRLSNATNISNMVIKNKTKIYNEKELVFELDMYVLDDTFYEVDKNIAYNPIKRVIKKNSETFNATRIQHNEYTNAINTLLNK